VALEASIMSYLFIHSIYLFILLRRHLVSEVVGVDASSGYLAAAEANAKELGLADAVSYHREDFALSADQFMPADVVTMDRVICCYPHLQQLLRQAAEHTKQYLAISFPADQLVASLAFSPRRWTPHPHRQRLPPLPLRSPRLALS
jgi:predicted TPR repeat methyltransferase